jgi:hypothetical protein
MADTFAKARFLLMLCVLAILLTTSGCTTQTGGSAGGGPGLVLENFKTTLDTVDSGEPVGLQLEVRTGGIVAVQ